MSSISSGGGGVPVGTIAAHPANIPGGWLECDGAAISRTDYAALFNEIGTTYGVGDGSTTFNIPDLRGEFVRGFDNGAGVDAGRSLASSQADEVGTHNHSVEMDRDSAQSGGGTNKDLIVSSGGGVSRFTQDHVGAETRPRNVAMYYGIKY